MTNLSCMFDRNNFQCTQQLLMEMSKTVVHVKFFCVKNPTPCEGNAKNDISKEKKKDLNNVVHASNIQKNLVSCLLLTKNRFNLILKSKKLVLTKRL